MTGLDLQILGPALIAGLLVLATHVPLGMVVLDRSIIFIDIALAQVAATGVVFGRLMWGDINVWVIQASAIGAALLCAALLVWTDRRYAVVQEAIIGAVYVTAAAVQLMLLSYNPSGAEFLKQLLVGQILWVSPLQLVIVGLVYAVALVIWFYRDLSRETALFYLVFAVVITLSVQIVGILLVFASLIIPALATRAAPRRWRLLIAFNVGVAGYVVGLVISALFNTPTGAATVCALVPAALVAGVLIRRSHVNSVADSDDPVETTATVT
jgi:zinc/manganese transport system permease protein